MAEERGAQTECLAAGSQSGREDLGVEVRDLRGQGGPGQAPSTADCSLGQALWAGISTWGAFLTGKDGDRQMKVRIHSKQAGLRIIGFSAMKLNLFVKTKISLDLFYSFHSRLSVVDVLCRVLRGLQGGAAALAPASERHADSRACTFHLLLPRVEKCVAVSGEDLLLEKEWLVIGARNRALRAERLYL